MRIPISSHIYQFPSFSQSSSLFVLVNQRSMIETSQCVLALPRDHLDKERTSLKAEIRNRTLLCLQSLEPLDIKVYFVA